MLIAGTKEVNSSSWTKELGAEPYLPRWVSDSFLDRVKGKVRKLLFVHFSKAYESFFVWVKYVTAYTKAMHYSTRFRPVTNFLLNLSPFWCRPQLFFPQSKKLNNFDMIFTLIYVMFQSFAIFKRRSRSSKNEISHQRCSEASYCTIRSKGKLVREIRIQISFCTARWLPTHSYRSRRQSGVGKISA